MPFLQDWNIWNRIIIVYKIINNRDHDHVRKHIIIIDFFPANEKFAPLMPLHELYIPLHAPPPPPPSPPAVSTAAPPPPPPPAAVPTCSAALFSFSPPFQGYASALSQSLRFSSVAFLVFPVPVLVAVGRRRDSSILVSFLGMWVGKS